MNSKEINSTNKLCITVRELSQELGIGLNSCYNLVHQSDFPKIMTGNKIYVYKPRLNEWLEANLGKKF